MTRDPEKDKEITGQFLTSADKSPDTSKGPAVAFHFNVEGGNRFNRLTSTNAPETKSEDAPGFKRQLAILLDDQIVSAPSINAIISQDGVTGVTPTISSISVGQFITVLGLATSTYYSSGVYLPSALDATGRLRQ